MTKFATFTCALALTVSAGIASAQAVGGFAPQAPRIIEGQWMVAPNGCSYSRTQAPGQPVMWMLIKNPHHIGGRNAHSGCPSIIQG